MMSEYTVRRMFIREKPLVMFHVISYRVWGQPKLEKPKILKNVKPAFKLQLNKKLNINVFVVGNDVYVKHIDWYSRSYRPHVHSNFMNIHNLINDFNTYFAPKHGIEPINQKQTKFIYADSFGDIILRGNAWILYKNLVRDLDGSRNTYFGTVQEKMIYMQSKWEKEHGLDGEIDSESLRMIQDLCCKLYDYFRR